MRIFCRLLGHKASRHHLRLDPVTFREHSHCKHCDAPLERHNDGRWRRAAEQPTSVAI